jgi:hypothetical protein
MSNTSVRGARSTLVETQAWAESWLGMQCSAAASQR